MPNETIVEWKLADLHKKIESQQDQINKITDILWEITKIIIEEKDEGKDEGKDDEK